MEQFSNQFEITKLKGTLDATFGLDSLPCSVSNNTINLFPAQPVKISQIVGGVPKVEAVTNLTDLIFGFITYDLKSPYYQAGNRCTVSIEGNVMFMEAAEQIDRMAKVSIVLIGNKVKNVLSGENVIGWTLDEAEKSGDLIRVYIKTPNVSEKGSKGDKGDPGADGIGLDYNWQGTELGIKREDESEYVYVDLKGEKGDPGQSDTRNLVTTAVAEDYDILDTDYFILVDASSDPCDIKLPNPAINEGKEWYILAEDVTNMTRAIPFGSETFNGEILWGFQTDYQGFTFRAYNGNWIVY